jgi:hypothetical protein
MTAGRKTFVAVLAGLMLFVLALGMLVGPTAPSYADTVPTPAAHNPSDDALYVVFWNSSAKAADAGSNAYQLMRYELLDVQYVIDQGTTNTSTLRIQYSNDNSNWSDGPALVSNNAADADSMVQVTNLGRYTRIYADVTNTNTITFTVKAVAK